MKRYIFSLQFLFPVFLAAQGMQFEHSAWKDVLAKAKSENKLVFMDAYTVWCGPCKMMSAQTFPDAEVGKFFNEKFVNVKMDMEKGEGIGLAKTYGVELYPTLLFLDGEGSVVHRVAGFHGPKEFIELGKTAVAPEKRLTGLAAKYNKGDRNPDLLYNYANALGGAFDPRAGEVADEYLKTQGDLGSEKNMDFIMQNLGNPLSPAFQYLIKNRAQFEKKYGGPQVGGKIEQVFQGYLSSKPDMTTEEADKLFMTVFPEKGAEMASRHRMTSARQKGDREGFAKAAVEHFGKYPSSDPDELNEVAWTFYKVVEDKKMLKQAVKWAKKSVSLNDAYYNNDTLAALYYKLKKKKPAIKAARKAIDLAKTAGEDYSSTQTLLDDIYKL